MVNPLTDLGGDAVAFVAHDDGSVRGERLCADVLTVEQSAIDGLVVG